MTYIVILYSFTDNLGGVAIGGKSLLTDWKACLIASASMAMSPSYNWFARDWRCVFTISGW